MMLRQSVILLAALAAQALAQEQEFNEDPDVQSLSSGEPMDLADLWDHAEGQTLQLLNRKQTELRHRREGYPLGIHNRRFGRRGTGSFRLRKRSSRASSGRQPKLVGQGILKLDTEAKEDFVRRCVVSATVSEEKFLPVTPLERFCSTTDAVVECRLEVGKRLKDTHARDGDMGKFCVAVYDWFQAKYGMKCPAQCKKLQCKSTCAWLAEKKKLGEDSKVIKADMEEAEKHLAELKKAQKVLKAKTAEVKKLEFDAKQNEVRLDRAKKTLDEKIGYVDAEVKKKEKVDASVGKLEKAISDTEEKIYKAKDDVMKFKFSVEKAELKHSAMMRAAKRLADKAEEASLEQNSLQDMLTKLQKEQDAQDAEKKELGKTVDEEDKAAKVQAAVLQGKVDKLKKAMATLDTFKVKGASSLLQEEDMEGFSEDPKDWELDYKEHMVGNYEGGMAASTKELVKSQYVRAKAEKTKLDSIEQTISDAKDEIKEIEQVMASRKERMDKMAKGVKDVEAQAKSLMAQNGKDIAEANMFKKKHVTDVKVELEKATKELKKEQASLEKAKKTLKFMQGLQKESSTKVEMVEGNAKNAQMSYDLADGNLKTTEEELNKKKGALQKALLDEKEMKKDLAKEESMMMKRIKDNKAGVQDLNRFKPIIVKLHSLTPAD